MAYPPDESFRLNKPGRKNCAKRENYRSIGFVRASKEDGPQKPDEFWWNGQMVAGFTAKEMEVMQYVWDRRDDPPTTATVERVFWPDSFSARNNLDRLTCKVRGKLRDLSVTIGPTNGILMIAEAQISAVPSTRKTRRKAKGKSGH